MNKLIVILVIILFFILIKINKNEKFISKFPFIKDNIFKGHKPCKNCKRPGNSCSLTRH